MIIFILLFFFAIFLFLLFPAVNLFPSDKALHILFIDLIRKNNHKFINQCTSYLVQNKMTYPQLIHWILSFLPERSVGKAVRYFALFFSIGSLIFFMIFCVSVHAYLPPSPVTKELFILLAGLIFITTPFNYFINNAKNGGISARGLGLMLGQIYTYCIALYMLADSPYYLFAAGISALLILMSNQFAAQYLLFSTPLFMVFYHSWIIIAPLTGAVLIFFASMPRIAWQFFAGNIRHKIFYYRYLAGRFILKYRESIWKDVFWEIWKLILTNQKPKGGGTLFMYIYTNPFIILVFLLPLALPLCIYFLSTPDFHDVPTVDSLYALTVPVIASCILFMLFSFRKTRFLGEPERYAEFATGFMAISVVFLLGSKPYILYSLVSYQAILILLQATLARIRSNVKLKKIIGELAAIQSAIAGNFSLHEEINLLSNSTETIRALADASIKIFYGSLYSEWYGKYHFTDLYNDYLVLREEKILPVIEEFKINGFVLDTRLLPVDKFYALIRESPLHFKSIAVTENLIAFKVC